jgi:hypothetical protein
VNKLILLSCIALSGCIDSSKEEKDTSIDTAIKPLVTEVPKPQEDVNSPVIPIEQLPAPVGPPDPIETPDPIEEEDPVTSRSSVAPLIAPILPLVIDHTAGANLSALPQVQNAAALDGVLHWTKSYGPDDVNIHPESGLITWDIPNDMPSESFHIGIKASSISETVSLSFIVHAGVSQVLTVGTGGDYTTLKAGMSALNPGGTLVILDGEYSGEVNYVGFTDGGAFQHPPSGSETAFTTIMAENPGEAILKDGAYIAIQALNGYDPVSYVAIKGLFIKGGQIATYGYGSSKADSTLRHHHLKFIRNGVEADEKTPFNAFRCDDILFENNYAFGGGRYKFASYQAENIVWRRNVARYDRGTVHDEPKGTYSVYTTMDALLSNNLAIDGDNPDFVMQGEIAGEFATPTTSGATRAVFKRNMQINSAFMFANLSFLAGDSDVELKDMVSWDVRPDKSYVKSFASGWLDHITMGDVEPRNFADQFFNGWSNNFRGVTNSILHNFKNGNMFYSLKQESDHVTVDGRVVDRFGADTLNITEFNGTLEVMDSDIVNISNFNPLQSDANTNGGLKYLTRTEPNTNLSDIDNTGNALGATVMTFLGRSGTLHGEEGYDEETGVPMWPFPMEDIIKNKFSQYSYSGPTYTGGEHSRSVSGSGTINGARGFSAEGQNLTHYIWGYLGHVVPPFDVTATATQSTVILQWSASSINNDEVSSHSVYQLNANTNEKVLVEKLVEGELILKLEGLMRNTEYKYVVTRTIDGIESGFSYPITIETL